MPTLDVRHLGDFIREQRETAKISVRELAKSAGVSNPYLSQIERGLRKPSAQILQQIAKGLRISAEVLYVQAGILDERAASPVVDAILADEALSERQKQVLLEIHDSFRKENLALAASLAEPAPVTTSPKKPVKKAAKKSAAPKKTARPQPVTTLEETPS